MIVDDGATVQVSRSEPPRGADATVRTSAAAFAAALAGEPPPEGQRVTARGDLEAVRHLKTWTEWAQAGGRPVDE